MSSHSFRRTAAFILTARQRGAVAIIVALALPVLIGFIGLALDLGKLYVAKTELQNSADACALAASRELTGVTAAQFGIAEAAGITTGQINLVMFQSETVDVPVDAAVTFSDALNGTYLTKNNYLGMSPEQAAAVRYVRCEVTRDEIPTWFMQALNFIPGISVGNQAVAASAVATVSPSQTNCALPVAICSADLAGKVPGDWLEGAIGPPGGELTGNFKWIDFTPPGGGASELGSILTGSGVCNLPSEGTEVGQTGNIASLSMQWNSRFGISQGSVSPGSAVPDFTGYAYTEVNWPSQFNAYDNAGSANDFREMRAANAAYQGNADTGLNVNGTVSNSTYLATNGGDRRLAVVPVVDCGTFGSSQTAPVESWACILMLHPLNQGSGGGGTGSGRMFLEYLGASSLLGSPCATLGTPGGAASAGPMVPVLVQ